MIVCPAHPLIWRSASTLGLLCVLSQLYPKWWLSFAALIAAQVAVMRLFGTGLTLAILVDATLVRLVLVPAFMHVMGRWNWWAPKPLVRIHRRLGISESGH